MKTKTIPLIAAALMMVVTGCATRGPKLVTALPMPGPTIGPTNWMKADAPRTQPGKLMDPDAVTFGQVPTRIIYMPGQEGTFGRTSARQEVAYKLVPVDRIPEIQAQGTPVMDTPASDRTTQEKAPKAVFSAAFKNKDGVMAVGTARRLGVLGQTEAEKTRAESLLSKGETLQWTDDVGWVGFTEKDTPKPLPPQKKNVPIPEIPDAKPSKAPEIKKPESVDTSEKTPAVPLPEIPEKNKDKETKKEDNSKEGTPVKEGKPETDKVKLQKTIGMEISFEEQ